MRILLLGRKPDSSADEGMKNVLRQLSVGLAKRHEIRILDPRDILHVSFWREIRSFRPDILHYIAGPTLFSLILLRYLSITSSARSVVTLIHPWFPHRTGLAIGAFLPDLVLATSQRTAALFTRHSTQIEYLPFGVDTYRFLPANADQKEKWRSEFGLPADRYLILHVGHIVQQRGLEVLARLPSNDQLVLIIGSVTTPADRKLQIRLEDKGVIVWTRLFPEIEKIYALADCYSFPTQNSLGAIEIPLSVLEAMSCNLPILMTRFGGLPDLFPPDNGIVYENRLECWPERISDLRSCNQIQNRSKVIPLDWEKVILQLEDRYSNLLRKVKRM